MTACIFLIRATLFLFGAAQVSGCGRGSISIRDNGYRSVLIAINKDVPEDQTLIARIMEVFTQMSARLYQVTRKRAYLADVKILLPKSWASKPEYSLPGTESLDTSDIQIDRADSDGEFHRPFVVGMTECLKPGLYMRLTSQYLLDQDKAVEKFGPMDKLLVHEWAHLRYGVFNEFPSETEPQFYSAPGGAVEATRCSLALTGYSYDKSTFGECGSKGTLPNDDCRYNDVEADGTYGSLMYRHYLDHVVEFCDDDEANPKLLHNPHSPSEQNRKCDKRSVWGCLREHDDFFNVNPPRDIADTTPTFTLLRPQEKRYVLVLDTSGSMGDNKRMANMGKGCSNFIMNIIKDGEMLGVALFESKGSTSAGMTVVSNQTRTTLQQAIPTNADGGTSIGSGIRQAIQVLKAHNGIAKGGILIIVSDGNENESPRISDVWNEAIDAGVTIHSIAFTDNADQHMDKIAKETGGRSFLYSNDPNSNAINEAFQNIAGESEDIKQKKLPISSTIHSIHPDMDMSGICSIDSTLGRNSEFLFDYSGDNVDITIVSPKNEIFVLSSPVVSRDIKFGMYKFKINGTGQAGEWKYKITNLDRSVQRVVVSVLSQSAVEGAYPIIAQAFWGHRTIDLSGKLEKQVLYASVSQGYKAVLNAEVVASVEGPGGFTETIVLSDTGAGADQTKDDGVYSEYFLNFNGDGRYNVKVLVNSTATTKVSSIRLIGQGAAETTPGSGATVAGDVAVIGLQRVASGGSFQLNNSKTVQGKKKLYEPGRITDLAVDMVDVRTRTIRLTWTAPGAELSKGLVSEYEIRYATNFESLSANFSQQEVISTNMVLNGNLTDPSIPGEMETVDILMPSAGDVTYMLSMISRDLDGRTAQSQQSNTVSVGMKVYVPKGQTKNNPLIIIGGVIGLLAMIIIIIVAIICTLVNKKQKRATKCDDPSMDAMLEDGNKRPKSNVQPLVDFHTEAIKQTANA